MDDRRPFHWRPIGSTLRESHRVGCETTTEGTGLKAEEPIQESQEGRSPSDEMETVAYPVPGNSSCPDLMAGL